jgi:hypothetical protein
VMTYPNTASIKVQQLCFTTLVKTSLLLCSVETCTYRQQLSTCHWVHEAS